MSQVNRNKFLSDSDILSLKQHLATQTTRDAIMLELLISTGARTSELLNIKASDVNIGEGLVLIHGLKGSQSREIPLPQALVKKLKAFLGRNNLNSQDRLFPISARRFRQIWNKLMPHLKGDCGAQGKGLHSIRHTFAIELFKKHRDIRLVQFALGHRSINNTLVYSEYVYKSEELRKLLT